MIQLSLECTAFGAGTTQEVFHSVGNISSLRPGWKMCCMTPRREEGHEEEGSTAEVQVGVWPPADCLDGRVKPVEKQVKFIGTLSLPVCSCVSAPPLS